MTKYIDEKTARQAALTGTMIGKTNPCRETKGMWWQVYWDGKQLTACVLDDSWGISCGEQISEIELDLYCDDPIAARRVMSNNIPVVNPQI